MDSVNFRIRSAPRMSSPLYNLRPVADALVSASRDRITRGVNILDQPAKPLTLQYAKKKVKMGALPIRNLTNTGALMSTYGVQTEDPKSIVIGWDAEQEKKVVWNEKRDKMAGLSPLDKEAGQEAAREELGNFTREVWTTARK